MTATINEVMVRILFIALLALSVLCMVPHVGGHDLHHLHHVGSVSCATCMGSASSGGEFFLLTLLGFFTVMIPVAPGLAFVKDQFHPPRILSSSSLQSFGFRFSIL